MKKKSENYLFLDFDGVLVTGSRVDEFDDEFGPFFDDGKADLIANLQSETDCRIVIISSWKNRAEGGIDAMQRMADERKLPFQIFDTVMTNDDPRYKDNKGRGDQIKLWLEENAESKNPKFCILDDCEPYFFRPEQLLFFVKVNARNGITEDDCQMAKAFLQPKENYQAYKHLKNLRTPRP